VSKQAITLIEKLLQPNPADRIKAESALTDPWFDITKKTATEYKKLKGLKLRALQNLKTFKSAKRLQQITIQYIVQNLASKEELFDL
jgi:serine/threonine protein kinase